MQTIQENLNTPVAFETDVLVAGGGFAGIAAALSAARNGAKVLLIEKSFMLGGLGTSGLITIYLPLCDGEGHQVSFSIAEELLRVSIKHGAEDRYPSAWLNGGTLEEKIKNRFLVQYNAQSTAILYEQLLREAGVEILYGTSVCAVKTENQKVTHVMTENKSGRQAIKVKSVVDATGDADIFWFANAKTETFKQGNILAAWYYYVKDGEFGLQQQGASDVPDKEKTAENAPAQLVNRRFTGLDGKELSEMVQLSHDFVLNHALERDRAIATMATIPQIRMTRRLEGLYVMDDTEMHKEFSDSVGMFADWRKRGPCYELPFRTLYGEDLKNVIGAGRCISVTDAMWDITRVIPVCSVTGEAAGLAASMTDDFSTLNVADLQSKLVERGVKLHEDF